MATTDRPSPADVAALPDGRNLRTTILRAATRLFAERGYDGVSTREIAAAAKLNVATVNYHVGGKESLYLEVQHRARLREEAAIADLVEDVPDSTVSDPAALRDLLARVIDAMITLDATQPEVARLHVYRWLETDRKLSGDAASLYDLPLHRLLSPVLARATGAGTIDTTNRDIAIVMQQISWMLHGHFAGPPAPIPTRNLRPYLVDYVCHMLNLPLKNWSDDST
jgi:AcrR family transcriptional regulator